MDLKEDFKKALKGVGIINDYGYERYGFQNVEGWPELDFVKEDYENYQKHPEEYDYIEKDVSFDDFIDATIGHDMYEPGDTEEIDCENLIFTKFEILNDKIELVLYVGGDWQPPHLVKVTFENNKLSAENLGLAPKNTEVPEDLEKEFLKYIEIIN